jgi:hypothetical protein
LTLLRWLPAVLSRNLFVKGGVNFPIGIDDLNVPTSVIGELARFFERSRKTKPLQRDAAGCIETMDFKHAVLPIFGKDTPFYRVVDGFEVRFLVRRQTPCQWSGDGMT